MSRERKVGVTCRPNIVPAGYVITRIGSAANWPLAIYRALKEIKKDPKLKGKRIIFPMHLTITDFGTSEDEE